MHSTLSLYFAAWVQFSDIAGKFYDLGGQVLAASSSPTIFHLANETGSELEEMDTHKLALIDSQTGKYEDIKVADDYVSVISLTLELQVCLSLIYIFVQEFIIISLEFDLEAIRVLIRRRKPRKRVGSGSMLWARALQIPHHCFLRAVDSNPCLNPWRMDILLPDTDSFKICRMPTFKSSLEHRWLGKSGVLEADTWAFGRESVNLCLYKFSATRKS